MALQFTKSMLCGGQPFTNAYSRLEAEVIPPGDKVRMSAVYYLSKTKYQEGEDTNCFLIDGVLPFAEFDYNREEDGSDILMFAHNQFKALLVSRTNTPGGDDKPNPFVQEFDEGDISIVDLT